LVKKAFERFPTSALGQAIEKANTMGTDSAADWLRATGGIASHVLDPAMMERVRRASVVLSLVEALDWLSDEVLKHGLRPWMTALSNAQDDITQTDRDRIQAFLFALAIAVGGDQVEEVLELSFGYLHDRIIHSYLSYPAQRLLQPKLPSAAYRDWDVGLKLRLAVTEAYVRFGLATGSFNRLLHDKKERKMLRRAADEVAGGERFADALRD
jgi:hypothetical protein